MTRALAVLFLLISPIAFAETEEIPADYVPVPGHFPPSGTGKYFAGELVAIDHVNRIGALRLDGDNEELTYHEAPSHRFALLPYGTLSYHGAPAELKDIPIGTHLHGYFVLPPEGDNTIAPPDKGKEKYVPRYNHALSLEDDFSFHQRGRREWKITGVDIAKGTLRCTLTGPPPADGPKGEKTFTLDRSTRVWKGRAIATLEDLAASQAVQINLTWAPDWRFGQFHAADVWIDAESRTAAAEMQRQIHIRYQTHHWLAGWVDHVEHQSGGKGIVTLTLFGGMDPELYEKARILAKKQSYTELSAAEKTLRTWWRDNDSKGGKVLDCKDLPNPPPGSSGLQIRVQMNELLDGYRASRVIRFRGENFPKSKLPAEERMKLLQDR